MITNSFDIERLIITDKPVIVKRLIKMKDKMMKAFLHYSIKENHIENVFLDYTSKHEGQTATIFGTGPSLQLYEYVDSDIRIGVNGIFKNPVYKTLDYYFFGDGYHNKGYPFRKGINDMINDYPNIQKFCCTYKHGKYIHFFDKVKEQLLLDKGVKCFDFCHNHFHTDINKYPMMNHSIIFSAVQFALYAGVKKIYLVGCDVTNKEGEIDIHYLYWWLCCKKFIQDNYPDVIIECINPVGLKGVFQSFSI